VINEYLEDVFPDDQPASGSLRPKDPLGAARMRYWNKFVDEHVMNHVSMHGWHRMVGVIARNIEDGTFEELLSHIPLPDQRKKWATARSGFSEADLQNASDKIDYALAKVEQQLGEAAWLAGDTYTLADINFYSHCGAMVHRMFPESTRSTMATRCSNELTPLIDVARKTYEPMLSQPTVSANARYSGLNAPSARIPATIAKSRARCRSNTARLGSSAATP
jgi:glutathione S-transferase